MADGILLIADEPSLSRYLFLIFGFFEFEMAPTYRISWCLCIVFLIKKKKKIFNIVLSCTCHSPSISEMANRDYIIMTCIKIKLEEFLAWNSIRTICRIVWNALMLQNLM